MFSFHNSFLFLLKRYPAESLQNEHFCPCYGIKSFQAAKCEWDWSRLSHALAVPAHLTWSWTPPRVKCLGSRPSQPIPTYCLDRQLLLLPWPSMSFPGDSDNKESACNAGDPGSVPGWGRSPGEGNGYPLPYSCLENPMDRGAWQATFHGVAKSRAQLSDYHKWPSLAAAHLGQPTQVSYALKISLSCLL